MTMSFVDLEFPEPEPLTVSDQKPFQMCEFDSSLEWPWTVPIKLVWTDPPFGTGLKRVTRNGVSYKDPRDSSDLTLKAIRNIKPFLADDATVCICLDYRQVHRVAVGMEILGFYLQGEVIWTFGLGRPRTSWWPNRHNTILTFTKHERPPSFHSEAIPREIRKAPKPGYPEDKPSGSVWDYTMSNTDPERVEYPDQKPLAIIEPFVLAHTEPGDFVADPFFGSGSTLIAAFRHDRRFIGCDMNPDALKVSRVRLVKEINRKKNQK